MHFGCFRPALIVQLLVYYQAAYTEPHVTHCVLQTKAFHYIGQVMTHKLIHVDNEMQGLLVFGHFALLFA